MYFKKIFLKKSHDVVVVVVVVVVVGVGGEVRTRQELRLTLHPVGK